MAATAPEPRVRLSAAASGYVDGIAALHRQLFERIHQLVCQSYPEAAATLSYGILAYAVGRRRLYVGVWQHGLSLYGWKGSGNGFATRHPELVSGKATIRLRPETAAEIPDRELRELVHSALSA
jgi:uncharacterized protein YdhG (YjbR/CyaY superfamily)